MTSTITAKRVGAFLLAFMLCFSFCIDYMTYKAQAVAIEASVIIFISAALVSAGLIFASEGDLQAAAISFWESCNAAEQTVIRTSIAAGAYVYDYVSTRVKFVAALASSSWTLITNWVNSHYQAGENVVMPEGYRDLVYEWDYARMQLDFPSANYSSSSRRVTYSVSNLKSVLPMYFMLSDGSVSMLSTDGTTIYYFNNVDDLNSYRVINSTLYIQFVPAAGTGADGYQAYIGSYDYVIPSTNRAIGLSYDGFTDISTVIGSDGIVGNPDYDWSNEQTGEKAITWTPSLDAAGYPTLDDAGIPVPTDVTGQLRDLVNTPPLSIPQADVSGVPIPIDKSIIDVGTATDYPLEGDPPAVDKPNIRKLLFSRFPFSLPWDLKQLFTLLYAPAEAPRFEIDLFAPVRDKWGITGNTTIVLDMAEYPIIGEMCRWTSIISFCLGLILATRGIIKS